MASSGVEYYGYCWNADLCTGGPSVPANQDPDDLPDIHVEPELTQELPPFQPPDTGQSVPVEGNGLCAENGGLTYQGQVCVCAGVVDNVTVCGDGTKIDEVTDIACTPDASCNEGSSGGGNGGSCPCQCTEWRIDPDGIICKTMADCHGNICGP